MPCKPLLAWYAQVHRDLPWRHTQEPYAIWTSEVMLQQTQVTTVLPRYHAWLQRFPNIQSLAEADLDAVLKAWEGLGYYRRARFLHQAAQSIMQHHAGVFPEQFDDIMALSGIGRSTAGAIASFCYQQYTPVLDANVKRVLRRWYADVACNDATLWGWAQQYIEASKKPDIWNQAMMELGATLCTAKQANCAVCPVADTCHSAFSVEANKPKQIVVQDVYWEVLLCHDETRGLWLQQRPEQGIWAGLWTPPIRELTEAPKHHNADYIHRLTHRRLHLYIKPVEDVQGGEGQWFNNLEHIALPTGIHHILEVYRKCY